MILNVGDKKIKIFTKKLLSGNYQVKFYLDSKRGIPYYGYMLVAPGKKISEVISSIYQKLQELDKQDVSFRHKKIFLNHKRYIEPNFMLFENNMRPET